MQVTIRQFVKDLQAALAQAQGSNAIQLGKGQCANFEEYKSKVGFIKGLEAGGELAGQMLRQMEDAERDEDLPPLNPVKDTGSKK